jgi:very-short-patch-repair endonuclease
LATIASNAKEVTDSAGVGSEAAVLDLLPMLANLRAAWGADKVLAQHETTFHELGMTVPEPIGYESEEVLGGIRLALAYLSQFRDGALPHALVGWLATGRQKIRVAELKTHAVRILAQLENARTAESRFADAGAVDLAVWFGGDPATTPVSHRSTRFKRALEAPGAIGRLGTYLRSRVAVLAGPTPIVCKLLEKRVVSGEQLPAVYDYLVARTLAQLLLRRYPELDRFSGDLHEVRRARFAQLDERSIELTRTTIAQIASRVPRIRGVGYRAVRDLTEEGLISHEIAKTRRHIPIREMFKRAGRAIQALKPCVMMGPQAVAQYLPPGQFHFDLVVMDEASQMRPEDALGAIARGSQLVVVGDPKQLGPSSFFSTQASDDDELEEIAASFASEAAKIEVPKGASVLERSESILLAAARRYPLRMLRWHYRSRYPELIAFSNHEFYGDDLVLFPHPGTERDGDGVNFRPIDNALYGSSTNPKEAEEVVKAVQKHAVECPERSLLVVTMNQPQRELVDTLIQRAEKDDAALSSFRARHENTLEPFGVKNLENVQGDERDVIFVSVTYGQSERGTVSQGFGPINAVGGERRLNVLFTRAKFRLDVFCSFDPSMLRVTEASPRGLCVFRDYLLFARDKSLATGRFTAREPDSDFEIEVARAIRAHGHDVHPQIGVAGYFLDLAIVDPSRPARYLLGVECDGATYHSAKSARDRDRLRQGVLEGLGWNIHRIWSTDWFRDPKGETVRLARHIEQLLNHEASNQQVAG